MNQLTEQFFRSSSSVFTHSDVSIMLAGSDFRRHGLIKRALASGEILRLRRGLYCLSQPYQKIPVNVYSLSELIYGPSYISMETSLSYHGWIPEAVYACTNASFGNSKEFATPLGLFSYQRVPQCVFFEGVERCVDAHGNVFFMSSPAKALTDYLYANQLHWLRIEEAVGSLRIDEEELSNVTAAELKTLLDNYSNGRVKRFLTGWLEELKS